MKERDSLITETTEDRLEVNRSIIITVHLVMVPLHHIVKISVVAEEEEWGEGVVVVEESGITSTNNGSNQNKRKNKNKFLLQGQNKNMRKNSIKDSKVVAKVLAALEVSRACPPMNLDFKISSISTHLWKPFNN